VTAMMAWRIAGLLLGLLVGASTAVAAESLPPPTIPNLFDPAHRLPKPDGSVKSIRFLTTDDFPPFHFSLPDGTLVGLDIDLARAICADLKVACTIQARRFDTLVDQIKTGKNDALIAAVANTPATRTDLDFTVPYYTTPARFATRAASPLKAMRPDALAGQAVGVQSGTAHEAYLRAFFPKSKLMSFPDQPALHAALRAGTVDAIFADGIATALWLNGTGAAGCCAFRDGPFTESRFFGNGVSIAVKTGNRSLRETLNYELAQLQQSGVLADLYLKYFPIGFY
jgi:polar amino acid transport system substrate-binding protein